MSLILDALRKSEAERRRGQAPDLFASSPVASAPRRGELSRYWPALVLGGLLFGAGFVFWQGRTVAPAAAVAIGGDAAPASAAETPWPTVAPAPPAVSAPAITEATASAAALPPPSAALPPPPAAAGAAPAASAATLAATPAPPRPATTVASAPSPAATLPTPPGAAASAASVTVTEADIGDSPPPIAILAASERAALPPLKLSMHVWNSEPGKRFAIIDGHRVTEGSSAGGSVIEEIRRDGVVLNVNGRRVLLPRP